MAVGQDTLERETMGTFSGQHRLRRPRLWAVVACTALLLVAFGCARRTSMKDLGSSGATLWARVSTSEGEKVTGELVSLDAARLIVALRYDVKGDVRIRGTGDAARLFSGTSEVAGELVAVTREEGGRVALVHRTFRAADIESVTFHQDGGSRSLGSIVSTLLGPVVGGALALAI